MTGTKIFKTALLSAVAALALAACSDSSTELASPGTEGPNPGVGDGGGTGDDTNDETSAGDCPTGTEEVTVGTETHCQLGGEITTDLTLTAGNLYALNGSVKVGRDDGNGVTPANTATLTIEPGAIIYGATAQDVLIVNRGSQIDAQGTASDPIIFTSALDLGLADELGLTPRQAYDGPILEEPFTSEWGGIIINGRATINTCNQAEVCEAEGEGDSGFYGGDDDADSSGTLRYVVVKYAGNPITATDELNGIAFQGVGSGTEVDYLQVHNGADDGIEFFGGTVNVKHLIITGADDDSIDWTFGWRGKIQHAIVIQNPNQPNSDRGIEADNLEGNNDFLPRSHPMIANFTLVGGAPDVGDTGVVLRRGTGANLYNVVATGWLDACYDLDDDATFTVAGTNATTRTGDLTIQSSLFDCADATDDEVGDPYDLETWYLDQDNNVIGTTTLSNFFINGVNENNVTAMDVSGVDAFFDATDYIGAVASDAGTDNWTLGWSYGLNDDPTCPDGTTDNGADGCILEGTYTDDIRLVAGLDYFLRGKVQIGVDVGKDGMAANGDPAVLTIDAGVKVAGENQTSYLVISRGSQIRSNGRADAPVVFTATNDDTRNLDTDTSLWGGIVINGRAPINTCNQAEVCEAEGEGDSGFYGGDVADDDSGQLIYTVVKYAGNPITATDELNGIAFQGVGSGTEVDYLQVHNGADDGVEFFGGTVNVKHVVITGADDDSLDWTFGWQGKAQYVLVVQNPNQPNSDRGIEADNLEGNNDYLPRSLPMISNLTLIGGAPDVGDTGVVLRRGTGANLYNVVATGWLDACYDIDDDATFTVAGPNATTRTGDLTIQSALFDCADATDDEVGDPYDLETWFLDQANNSINTANSLTAPAAGGKAYINGANEAGVTAMDVSGVDAFFDATDFIGAVESEAADWTAGWTVWLDQN